MADGARGGGVGRYARPAVPQVVYFYIHRCNFLHVFPVIHTFIPPHSHRSPPPHRCLLSGPHS
eukprot:6759199-Prymnesium_polylepis.1